MKDLQRGNTQFCQKKTKNKKQKWRGGRDPDLHEVWTGWVCNSVQNCKPVQILREPIYMYRSVKYMLWSGVEWSGVESSRVEGAQICAKTKAHHPPPPPLSRDRTKYERSLI